MQLTLHAARRIPHRALRLMQATSARSVKTRRARAWHLRDARVCDHTTTVVHDMTTPAGVTPDRQRRDERQQQPRTFRVTHTESLG